MKKQINPTLKRYLLQGVFSLPLLLAIYLIPVALAQQNVGKAQSADGVFRGVQVAPRLTGLKRSTATSGSTGSQAGSTLAAPGAPLVVLYDQYDSDFNDGIVSSDRTDNSALSAEAADNFVVPAGQTWTVTEVDIRSPDGFTAPTSFAVHFYTDAAGLPGSSVYDATGLAVAGNPDYTVMLTTPAVLSEGTYWVSVTGTINGTNWYWEGRNVTNNGFSTAWRNPGGGYGTGCTDWGRLSTCIGQTWPDQMFRIVGTTASACTLGNYVFTTGSGGIVPGTTDTGNHEDDGTTTINLPFPVQFYDQSFNTTIVGSNGTLGFVANGNAFTNACLPAASENMAILPHWDDLRTDAQTGCAAYPGGTCGIYTSTTGAAPNRVFNIEWRAVYFSDTATRANFEVRLFERDSHVEIIYGETAQGGSSATIGVQRDTGSMFTEFACNVSGTITNGLKLTADVCSGETGCTSGSWSAATPYPTTIVRYGFAQTTTHFYVFGGVSDGTTVNSVNRMDLSTGMWQARAPMPFTSEAPTCALMPGTNFVYCAEGDTGNGFARYDISTDTWMSLAPVPGTSGNHYGSASGAFNGKVFVAGGTTGITNEVQVYDVATNTWSAGTPAPANFLLAGYQQAGHYLYVVGGFSSAGPNGSVLNSKGQNISSVLYRGKRPDLPAANLNGTWRLDMSSAPGAWSVGPAFPQMRADFGLVYRPAANALYALGGDASGGSFFDSTNVVDELTLSAWPSGIWVPSLPDLPMPARQANQAGFNGAGQIWSVGGLVGQTFQFLSEVLRRPLDCPCSPTWQSALSMTTARRNAATAAAGSNLYAITGFNGTDYVTINERFDGTTWTTQAPIPVRHAQGRAAAVGSNVYVPGGYNSIDFSGPLDTMQIYNTGTNTWTMGTTLPAARSGVATAAFNGLVYVIAGYNPVGTGHNEVYIYDPVANSYTTGAPMPGTQGNVAAVLLNGEIYVVGGGTAPGAHYAYNPTLNTWRTIASIPTSDGTCQSDNGFALDNELWVVGCLNQPINQQVWTYNPGTDMWRAGSLYDADHQGPGATLFHGRGFVVGGGAAAGGSTAVESIGSCTLTATGAVSRKIHGAAGLFDVNLPLTGTPGIECRSGGGTNDFTMVVTFAGNVSVTGSPQAEVTTGSGTIGTGGVPNGGMVTVSGAVVTIPLTSVANAQTINVTLHGVSDGNATGDVVIPMSVLLGDTNANGAVSSADISQTKAQTGQTTTGSNFREDTNVSGSITSADISQVKAASGTSLPPLQ